MVETLRPIDDADSFGSTAPQPAQERAGTAGTQKLWVKLPGADAPALKRIELILTMFPGQQQLIIWCEREKKKLVARCVIHDSLVAELREMLGDGNVVLK